MARLDKSNHDHACFGKKFLMVLFCTKLSSFVMRVGNGSANEEITIRVERELIIPVRSKVLLGGATR